ncbi:MAG: ABC transporter permease [Bacillati bacterium ANGP1]|uniref:ABC transporter permease n=1 Tax=Candidatus Segetimicrobium genomatis TaxID=2569760 RepID=A0A537K999_9BACT|nr:MAG: ABC transporter permease [Terrabacteria group bacterium ANGP1]
MIHDIVAARAAEQRQREAARARTPLQLAWRQLRRYKLALISGAALAVIYVIMLFAEFVAPYGLDFTDRRLFYAPPVGVHLIDARGRWHARPFVYAYRLIDPGLRLYAPETSRTYDLHFFARGSPYRLLGFVPTDVHLMEVDAPARLFLFGSDQFGRDLLSRMLYGSRVSLLIGIIVVLITFPIGLVLGGIAGYYGGIIDNVLMRAVEVLASFPTFYLLLTLATVLPATLSSAARIFMIAAVFSLVGWGGLARIIRGLVLSLRELEFVLAARAAGLSDLRVIVRHILPSTSSYVIVAATLTIPGVILGESGLSYLGIGVQEPSTSWGLLLAQAQSVEVFTQFPWLLLPGLAIVLVILFYNFLGDGVRDALDPRQRST